MNSIFPGETLYRPRLMTLLHTALAVGETRFARRLALSWLAAYPGDLQVCLLNAKALIEENHPLQAIEILEQICITDVEYLQAVEHLRIAQQKARQEINPDVIGAQYALGGKLYKDDTIPDWAINLRGARQAKRLGFLERANELIQNAQSHSSDICLVAVTHVQIFTNQTSTLNVTKDIDKRSITPNITSSLALRSIAEAYHLRWPACLQLSLLYAQALIDSNDDETAVTLLHQSAAQDITGQVATRLWGSNHIYKTLWPDTPNIIHDQPIPASVAASLGWNQLPKTTVGIGQPRHISSISSQTSPDISSSGKSTPKKFDTWQFAPSQDQPHTQYSTETLRSVHDELNMLATRLKQPNLNQNDGRFPVYIIFTTHSGLEAQYGLAGLTAIDNEMKHLVKVIRSERQWGAVLYYADQGGYGVLPTKPNDPWGLKLALVDLDVALAQRGERIGAVLIVGGPQVVPFHHLPNPVDDADVDVPSDNPYGTRDENYFIPEWPIGRLPGDASDDPAPLLTMLKAISARHEKSIKQSPWYIRWWLNIRNLFNKVNKKQQPSLGYTAAIWRRASLAVFRPVGDGRALKVSPPEQAVNAKNWSIGSIGYFNLHGLVDSAEWYGQRDPTELISGPDYPVVLRPSDVVNGGRAPNVIFTEACYGAHISERSFDEALALKFLTSGSQAVVGSTCTSYGSVSLPLIAADLLGRSFWKYLRDGHPVGEALRRAKIALAREMNRRQGYLDGEDQKTLISFILYGDPLALPTQRTLVSEKITFRSNVAPTSLNIVCDRYEPNCDQVAVTSETLAQVKSIVSQYLPGMSDAHLILNHQKPESNGTGYTCPTSNLGTKNKAGLSPTYRTIVLSKTIHQADLYHCQYARLKLDESGRLLKLAVSR